MMKYKNINKKINKKMMKYKKINKKIIKNDEISFKKRT